MAQKRDSSPKRASNSATISVRKASGIDYAPILSTSNKGSKARSSIELEETKSHITIKINASDPAALRASFNSVMKDLQVIEDAAAVTSANVKKVKVYKSMD